MVLAIEVISSTATFGYAVLLIKHTRSKRTKGLPISEKGALPPNLEQLQFRVRVLIPCYKEATDLVKETVLGALKAPLPKDTLRTVYLCDDGKDPSKEAMVRELNKEWGCLEYVSGRTRDPKGALFYGVDVLGKAAAAACTCFSGPGSSLCSTGCGGLL